VFGPALGFMSLTMGAPAHAVMTVPASPAELSSTLEATIKPSLPDLDGLRIDTPPLEVPQA
jgi:hypothetical protein